MSVYIVNFEKYYGITKIGKADDIKARLCQLEKQHGSVVNVCYFECKGAKESLMWEEKIHNSFLEVEYYNPSCTFESDYRHKLKGDGSSEFFMLNDVLSRFKWLEGIISVFNYPLKYAINTNNGLHECTKEEYLLANLHHNKRWAFNTFWNGDETEKGYKEDVKLFKDLTSKTGSLLWLAEEVERIEKTSNKFIEDIRIANEIFPDKKSIGQARSYLSLYQSAKNTMNHINMSPECYVPIYNSFTTTKDRKLELNVMKKFIKLSDNP